MMMNSEVVGGGRDIMGKFVRIVNNDAPWKDHLPNYMVGVGYVVDITINSADAQDILVCFPGADEQMGWLHSGNGFSQKKLPKKCWWFCRSQLRVVRNQDKVMVDAMAVLL